MITRNITAPAAQRIRRFRWRDVRLWVGLGLILVSMVLGARLLSGPDGSVTVWRASHDLAPGSTPLGEPVRVTLGAAADDYLPADAPLAGRMLLAVPEGALIPVRAVGQAPSGDHRLVTVPVDPLHAPVGLTTGDRVDVWATAAEPVVTGPRLVLASVLVVAADRDNVGMGGEMPVVLEVPQSEVAVLVEAMRSAVIDLSAVPITETSA